MGGMGGGRSRGPRRTKNLMHQMSVSLEEMYNGATRKLALEKNVICSDCDGIGGKEGAVQRCPNCRGSGMQVRVQQLGPGMMQQIQSMCGECQGTGERIDPKLRCKKCVGKKVTRERKILEVVVDKGMADGQKVTFSGEGDQEPGLEPGDIIIVLDEKEHPNFKRSGTDLIMKFNINITEALCGFKKTVTTLDDRTLVIQTIPGECIKTGDLKCVFGEGMPTYRNPFEKGKLIIQGISFSSFGTIAGSMESGNSTLNWIMSFPFSKGLRYVGMPSPKTHFRSPVLMHSPGIVWMTSVLSSRVVTFFF